MTNPFSVFAHRDLRPQPEGCTSARRTDPQWPLAARLSRGSRSARAPLGLPDGSGMAAPGAVLDPVCAWQDGAKFTTASCADVLSAPAARALFDGIEVDPYIPAGYRYKAMTRVRVRGGQVEEQPHGPLHQPADVNTLQQGRSRTYGQLRGAHVLDGLIRRFAALAGIDHEHEILVQAQRTHCVGGALAEPAAEGFHRDGIDFLAIVCVRRENIRGGVTMLAKSPPATPEFEQVLRPLQMLLVDDRAWFHYTSPITPRDSLAPANRDVILLSTSRGTVNRSPEDARAALDFAAADQWAVG